MKLFKSIAFIFLSSLFITGIANAEPAKKNTQNKTQNSAKQTPAEDKNLKQFNDNVAIKLTDAQLVNQNQQEFLQLVYSVENKNKKQDIQSLNWVGAFLYEGQVFFAQDIPVTFKTPLKRSSKEDVTVTIPFAEIPEQARTVFLNPQIPASNVVGAKNVVFANGTKIEVK